LNRTRLRLIGAAAAAVAVAVAGCAAPAPRKVDFSEARRGYRAADYPQVLHTWTRYQKRVRLDVGTVIEAWAVLKSWEFRQAFIENYSGVYRLSAEDRAALYKAQLEEARGTYELHLVVQSTRFEWNDLDSDSSPWKVSLVDGSGAEVRPSSIRANRLPELYETTFFPYRSEFSRTYVVRFDRAATDEAGFRGPTSGRVALRIAGPLGDVELVWDSL
jgi:hypothetical protein